MITIVCAFFEGNENVPNFSRGIYTTAWVDKLYRGCDRWLDDDFRFVCMSSHTTERDYDEPVEVIPFEDDRHDWLNLMEFYRPDLDFGQYIAIGLDTVITGPLKEIASYTGDYAAPHDPYFADQWCTAVVCSHADFSPAIWEVWERNRSEEYKTLGKPSDLAWLRRFLPVEPDIIDQLYPGQVISYPVDVLKKGHKGAGVSIVYFHGRSKPHLVTEPWIKDNWV